MMRPATSLFAKILFWFFLNLVLVAVALTALFAFQPQVNLHALFGEQGSNRLRTAGMLITHELNQLPQEGWGAVLVRHAAIHGVDFTLILGGGARFSSTREAIPEEVMVRVQGDLQHKPPRLPPPSELVQKGPLLAPPATGTGLESQKHPARGRKPPLPPDAYEPKPHLMMQSRNPTRYWSGLRIPLHADTQGHPVPAILLAVSDSITGNGFFFDPLPWMVVAVVVLLISVLLWVPMVRHITHPLGRMTRATEAIARGRFEVSIQEGRTDEIGRLAKSINRMAARLSTFVTGQKRFLGDVAHELGSPIARIQFGLGALEQRVDGDSRERVVDVMEDVDHLTKLVNELLAFSRAEIKSSTVKLDRIELLPVVEAAVKREVSAATEVDVQIDPGLQAVASAELLTRALSNLLRNAIKYAQGAGPISVLSAKRGDKVVLEVKDRGPGVPEEYLDRLFEPFFRPEAARDRDSGGVGLGLAIVKTCIDTCRGTVSAANLKPHGFVVSITLKAV
jgi:two-component system, OmpR family, sensor histidine kinase CpxA